jgi:very-short-patch-repair endonuclease
VQYAIVPKAPSVPRSLTTRPFSLEEARAAGLTKSALKGKAWKRIGAELYRWTRLPEDPLLTISAWQRLLPDEAVFAGATAAWLFGLDLKPTDPVEIVVPPSSSLRSRAGLSVRRCDVPRKEVVSRRGFRATALLRTLVDLCLGRTPVEALVAIDMAVHAGLTDASVLCRYAEEADARAGAGRLRLLAQLAAPAESPMETRLRWLLVQAGLPRPEVQTNLRIGTYRFRADLYYQASKLVVEYDGGNHRERMVEDNRRQNVLLNNGYQVLRFTAADVYTRPKVVVADVRAALAGRQKTLGTIAQ